MPKIVVRQTRESALQQEVDLHPLLKRIYTARGVNSMSDLNYNLDQLLPYNNLLNINQAVDCLLKILEQQKNILIIGDFDVDGATSTALAILALNSFGFKNVSYLVPNRFTYGYGLTPEIVGVAAARKPDLIITVDNGISSYEGVEAANNLEIKVLITDHHISGSKLPTADAVINPNQIGDHFPSKHLAGVGVVFYLMLSLRARLRSCNWFAEKNIAEPNMARFLDLVALGTIADVVTLDRNNRILVQQGINKIRQNKCRVGIKALLDIAKKSQAQVISSDLAYNLGPMLNAAGRLEDMSLGIECLLCDDYKKAHAMALKLDNLNKERRAIEASMQQQAEDILSGLKLTSDLPLGICMYKEHWHQGVVGIVASRIKDLFHRPVVVFARVSEKELKGSARSIDGVHIRDVLDSIAVKRPGLINKFGGHAMAAGINLQADKYQDFCFAFNEEISGCLDKEDVYEQIYVDGELRCEDFNVETADLLRNAEPWGHNFPEPKFIGRFKVVQQRVINEKHLKMTLNLYGDSLLIEAIAFNMDAKDIANKYNDILAVFRLDINEYRGSRSLQLIVEHFE